MVVQGTVHNGVAVPATGQTLPEGADVTIIVNAPHDAEPGSGADGDTIGKRLMKFAGTATSLPSDMAEQHDHYIHGTPKR
jgi:hypothetical protein